MYIISIHDCHTMSMNTEQQNRTEHDIYFTKHIYIACTNDII